MLNTLLSTRLHSSPSENQLDSTFLHNNSFLPCKNGSVSSASTGLVDYKMGSTNSKVQCLMRPGQSGKTRAMQGMIKEYEAMSELFLGKQNNYLNIVICSNNRKLVEQTNARHTNDLYSSSASVVSDDSPADDRIEGRVFSWMSGGKNTNVPPDALAWKVLVGDVTMIVCCAHKKRLTYLDKLLVKLNTTDYFKNRVNIWIDEADESVKLWSAMDHVAQYSKVYKVTLVSATFGSVVKKWRLPFLPAVETHLDCYHKVSECNIVEDNVLGANAVEYLKEVFKRHERAHNLCRPGMRLFAPGDITLASHEDIAVFLRTKGFAVMVLNSKEKCIFIPNRVASISLEGYVDDDGTTEEIGKTLAKLYRDNDLARFPFAITGQMCIGRGLTFQNAGFLFDFGIVPALSDPATLYQCACRMSGNTKFLPGYKIPTLVMTTESRKVVENQEKIAVNLARLVHEHNLSDIGAEEMDWAVHGDRQEYDRAKLEAATPVTERIRMSEPFESRQEAREWGERMFKPDWQISNYNQHGTGSDSTIRYEGEDVPMYVWGSIQTPMISEGLDSRSRIMPIWASAARDEIRYIVVYNIKALAVPPVAATVDVVVVPTTETPFD